MATAVSKTTPTPTPTPSVFATAEAKAAHIASIVETHLKSMGLGTLQAIEQAVNASATLPFGLEPYRQEVVSFLGEAIAYAQDAITAAQMVAQLSAATAVAVAPAA